MNECARRGSMKIRTWWWHSGGILSIGIHSGRRKIEWAEINRQCKAEERGKVNVHISILGLKRRSSKHSAACQKARTRAESPKSVFFSSGSAGFERRLVACRSVMNSRHESANNHQLADL